MKDQIIELLRSTKREGIENLITFLNESDFFTAPSSTKYHGSHEFGLMQHSFNVYKLFKHKNKVLKLNLPEDTVILTPLLHDLCKVNFYEKQQRWRKDDNNKWESYETYGVNDQFPMGHGENSVIRAMKYIKLTDQEIALIRWHMGFSVAKEEYMGLNNALNLYPEIAALHAADLESSYLFEKRGE